MCAPRVPGHRVRGGVCFHSESLLCSWAHTAGAGWFRQDAPTWPRAAPTWPRAVWILSPACPKQHWRTQLPRSKEKLQFLGCRWGYEQLSSVVQLYSPNVAAGIRNVRAPQLELRCLRASPPTPTPRECMPLSSLVTRFSEYLVFSEILRGGKGRKEKLKKKKMGAKRK